MATATNKAGELSLNPQPLPPKPAAMQSPLATSVNRGNAVSLNPQPLPPASPVLLPNQAPSALR